jgi:hypothetical protein
MAHDVFISYSMLDSDAANAVCRGLELAGIRCWMAPRDLDRSQSRVGSISDAIKACRVLLLIYSGTSNASLGVQSEVALADEHAKTIIPLRIKAAPILAPLRYHLGARHWFDALQPQLEQYIPRLAEEVAAVPVRVSWTSRRPIYAALARVRARTTAGVW